MPIQLTFIVVTAVVAALLGLGALLALITGRRDSELASDFRSDPSTSLDVVTKYDVAEEVSRPAETAEVESRAAYERVVRILWWLTIAIVLVGVGVSNAFAADQPLVFAIGGLGVVAVLVLHELRPERWRSVVVSAIEALIALALVTGLLVVTGYGGSPFFFALDIVAVAVALGHSNRIALVVSALATLAYLGVLTVDPARSTYAATDLLRFGLNIGSIWLLAYLAAVFAGQERRRRDRLIAVSQIDPLTGLFNRAHIFLTVEQEVRRTRRSARGFCLLMIDLDGLKAVNDTLGHTRGDEVLRALGAVIRHSIRTVDTAYRYGGDEFTVLLPETDIAGAFVVAEKIRAGAEEVGEAIADGAAETSVSIGLVSYPEDATGADELMNAADRAMYQAKSLGKNQISGVPRVRRAARHLPPPLESPPEGSATAVPVGEAPAPPAADPQAAAPQRAAPQQTTQAAQAATEAATATAAQAPPPAPVAAAVVEAEQETDEREPDPGDVRRQIAAARRSFDPDDQIRRAMDAFLSSPSREDRGHPDA